MIAVSRWDTAIFYTKEETAMPVISEETGRSVTARIEGEVDHHVARQLMEEVSRQLDAALPRRFVMDLGGVTFMDSSGIALVLRAYRRVCALRGKMELVNVPPQAAKVLKAAGVDKLLPWKG